MQLKPAVQELCEKYDLLEKIEGRQFEDNKWELLLWYVWIIELVYKASKWLEGEKYPEVCAVIPLIDLILSDFEHEGKVLKGYFNYFRLV